MMRKRIKKRKLSVGKTILLLLAVVFLASGTAAVIPKTAVTAEAATSSASKKLKKTASRIVDSQVGESDSQKTKLKKLFRYAEDNWQYKRAYGFEAEKGWDKDFALEMYGEKQGSCYHFAAAYAYLAKQATGYPVRIGVGTTNGFGNQNQNHAWVEVRIKSTWYVCDPNMDKFAADSSMKYFLKKRNSSSVKKTYYNYKKAKYYNVNM